MKTLRFLVILFILTVGYTTVYSQGQPLAVENASWLIHNRWPEMFGVTWSHSFFGYVINGDTTIDAKTFKKVYKFEVAETFRNTTYHLGPLPVLHSCSRSLFGFVRDENQKAYAIKTEDLFNCPSNTEYVLFDFNYQTGDTVKLCIANYPWYPPCMIDSIKQNELPYNRRTFYCSGQRIFYEGVGSNYGLFESLLYQIADIDMWLENFSTNGLLGLGVIAGMEELYNKPITFDLFPNPAQDLLKIRASGSVDFADLNAYIFNMQGQKIMQQNLNNPEIEISKLPPGVYLVKLKQNNKDIIQKKFVVIK